VSPVDVDGLGLDVPVPSAWSSGWATDRTAYWVWLDDDDGEPSIRITRDRVPAEGLRQIRASGVSTDDVLDALAASDASSALEGWGRRPETVERASVGRSGTDAPIPARLLTFRPDFEDTGPHVAIDVVFFVEPWTYLVQHLTKPGDEIGDRYRFERWLEGVRVDGSEE
jgi:hypothetical protein